MWSWYNMYIYFLGALKCLVEGGGQVAFVKHTTVLENTDGKRRAWWARNQLRGDFELLCPDGKRSFRKRKYAFCVIPLSTKMFLLKIQSIYVSEGCRVFESWFSWRRIRDYLSRRQFCLICYLYNQSESLTDWHP